MLTAEDRAILDFERAWWHEPGAKDVAIEMKLGISSHSYYEHLRGLVMSRAGMVYDPLTCRRVSSLIEPSIEVAV